MLTYTYRCVYVCVCVGSFSVSFYARNIYVNTYSEICTLYHGNVVENPMYTRARLVRAIEKGVGNSTTGMCIRVCACARLRTCVCACVVEWGHGNIS